MAAIPLLCGVGCGFSGQTGTGAGGTGVSSGKGGNGGSTATTGAGGSAAGGTTASGAGGLPSDAAVPVGGAPGGVYACTPGVEELVITDCGYPTATTSSNPLENIIFNESQILAAIQPAGSWPNGVVQMFYSDEHAMTLGVREVDVKSASGTTMTSYPVTALSTDPGTATNPQTGTNMLVGDQSGLDQSLRPMWPALFITDISTNPANKSGDWQQGGVPIAPSAVFGTWKAAVRNVDNTMTPPLVSITPDGDPMMNGWNLGGGDPVPMGLLNAGWGAEARWNVPLVPGHSYRLQVLVHDGDQRKTGGDSGEACVLFCAGGAGCGSNCGSTGTGGTGGTPTCPTGTMACVTNNIDNPASCPSGTVCANGCCLSSINIP